MSKFQNMGTFDAGTVGGAARSGRANPGIMTLDEAGIASGGAFLRSELEKRDPLIRKPLTSVTYPRDINISTGGGWVDAISAQSVGYGVTGGSGDGPRVPSPAPARRFRSRRVRRPARSWWWRPGRSSPDRPRHPLRPYRTSSGRPLQICSWCSFLSRRVPPNRVLIRKALPCRSERPRHGFLVS